MIAVVAVRGGRGRAAAVGRELIAEVPATPATVALLERWRDRAKRWRLTLAVPTVVATLAASIAVRGSVDVGVGAHPAWSDPVLTGLASVFVAGIAAELHHLRARATGPRMADLTPRDVGAHLPSGSRQRLGVLALLAAISVVLAVTVGGQIPVLGLLGLLMVVLVPGVQRRIVLRARPAVSSDLRAADDALRRLAVHAVDQAGAGLILLLAAWQLAAAAAHADLPAAVTALFVTAYVTAFVVALIWWWRSDPSRLLPDVPAALSPPRHQARSLPA